MRTASIALLAAVLAAALAAAPAGAAPAVDLAFRTVEKSAGSSSRLAEQRTIAIRSLRKWKQVWRQLHPTPKKRPTVDFAKRTLILATQGERPNSGYSITIERVVLDAGELTVHVAEQEPDPAVPTCSQLQVITRPYHLVRVRRTDRPIAPVQRRTVLAAC